MSATVITATIGRPDLLDCILSVANQTVSVQHLIIVDGYDHKEKVEAILTTAKSTLTEEKYSQIDVVYLPYPLKRWGGPIYSIGPTLAKKEYILNLDDDNTYDSNHVESLLDIIKISKASWAYSLRKITRNKEFVCNDNCESLGFLHHDWKNKGHYHIDTSSYCIPVNIAKEVAQYWSPNENSIINDRVFYMELRKRYPRYACTRSYTMNYEVPLNGKVNINYFILGNKWMEHTHGTQMPWAIQ